MSSSLTANIPVAPNPRLADVPRMVQPSLRLNDAACAISGANFDQAFASEMWIAAAEKWKITSLRCDRLKSGLRSTEQISAVDLALKNPGVTVISAPTGSGKTLIELCISAARIKNAGVGVLVTPLLDLVDQHAAMAEKFFNGRQFQVVKASSNDSLDHARKQLANAKKGGLPVLLIATPEIAAKLIDNKSLEPAIVKSLVMDECHHLYGKSDQQHYQGLLKFGIKEKIPTTLLSATVVSSDAEKQALSEYLSEASKVKIRRLKLPQPKITALNSDLNKSASDGWHAKHSWRVAEVVKQAEAYAIDAFKKYVNSKSFSKLIDRCYGPGADIKNAAKLFTDGLKEIRNEWHKELRQGYWQDDALKDRHTRIAIGYALPSLLGHISAVRQLNNQYGPRQAMAQLMCLANFAFRDTEDLKLKDKKFTFFDPDKRKNQYYPEYKKLAQKVLTNLFRVRAEGPDYLFQALGSLASNLPPVEAKDQITAQYFDGTLQSPIIRAYSKLPAGIQHESEAKLIDQALADQEQSGFDLRSTSIANIVENSKAGKILIYCNNRSQAQVYANHLNQGKTPAYAQVYTSALTNAEAKIALSQFNDPESDTRILIMTDKAGEGKDFSAGQLIVTTPPSELKSLVQLMGRVGRDGAEGEVNFLMPAQGLAKVDAMLKDIAAIDAHWESLEYGLHSKEALTGPLPDLWTLVAV